MNGIWVKSSLNHAQIGLIQGFNSTFLTRHSRLACKLRRISGWRFSPPEKGRGKRRLEIRLRSQAIPPLSHHSRVCCVTFAVLIAAPYPVVTQQPSRQALSSGTSWGIFMKKNNVTMTWGYVLVGYKGIAIICRWEVPSNALNCCELPWQWPDFNIMTLLTVGKARFG